MSANGWEAHAEPEFVRGTVRLYLTYRVPDGRMVVQQDGTVTKVDPVAVVPDDVGIRIPVEAWPALIELAVNTSDTGGQLRALRESLTVERERVDRVINRTIGVRQP